MDENKLLAMVITREQKGKRGGRTNMEPFIYYLSNYASKLQVCITFTKKKNLWQQYNTNEELFFK